MKLSDLLKNIGTGAGNLVNDYRRETASDKADFNPPEGSPGILEALKILSDENKKSKEIAQYGASKQKIPLQLIGDFLKVYLGGQRVNPMGGTYKDFEEPLTMQYSPQYEPMQIMDPMVESLMTPEVMEILRELQKKKSNEMLDQNWQDYGTQNSYRYLNDAGTQIGQ